MPTACLPTVSASSWTFRGGGRGERGLSVQWGPSWTILNNSGERCGPCAVNSKLQKFEHVWGSLYIRGPGMGPGPIGGRVALYIDGKYGDVKCIKGNGHMGPLCEQTDWKHCLQTTSLAGGKNFDRISLWKLRQLRCALKSCQLKNYVD